MFPQDRKTSDPLSTVHSWSNSLPTTIASFPPSLGNRFRLTGHFRYLVFRPTPGWFFVMHLDLATEDGLSVRISLSNLYKCFKKSATWAQLPLVYSEKTGEAFLVCSSERENESESLSQPAPENSRWTFLALDLQAMVFELFRNHYAHVKTVKLCANMTVKGAYTSDIKYCLIPIQLVTRMGSSLQRLNQSHVKCRYLWQKEWTSLTCTVLFVTPRLSRWRGWMWAWLREARYREERTPMQWSR